MTVAAMAILALLAAADAPPLPVIDPPAKAPRGSVDARRAELLFREGERGHGLEHLEAAHFAGLRDGELFFSGACAAGHLGRKDEALTWLERAADAGFARPKAMEHAEELAPG